MIKQIAVIIIKEKEQQMRTKIKEKQEGKMKKITRNLVKVVMNLACQTVK
jgi:hypothetical protein